MSIRTLIAQQETFYKNIVSVFCPILNETVYFTSEGFNHLIYKSNRKRRNISEQYMKLKCLVHAPMVIKNCILSSERQIKRKVKGRLKSGTHSALVYEVSKGVKIRVIVEKIGTGKSKFWSIMPHDKRSKPRPKTKKHPRRGAN